MRPAKRGGRATLVHEKGGPPRGRGDPALDAEGEAVGLARLMVRVLSQDHHLPRRSDMYTITYDNEVREQKESHSSRAT